MKLNLFKQHAAGPVICRRPDETIYAVVAPLQWVLLRERGKLDAWLDAQREAGIIIDLAED